MEFVVRSLKTTGRVVLVGVVAESLLPEQHHVVRGS